MLKDYEPINSNDYGKERASIVGGDGASGAPGGRGEQADTGGKEPGAGRTGPAVDRGRAAVGDEREPVGGTPKIRGRRQVEKALANARASFADATAIAERASTNPLDALKDGAQADKETRQQAEQLQKLILETINHLSVAHSNASRGDDGAITADEAEWAMSVVQGFSQLGYEVSPDVAEGKPYDQGMGVIANFVEDESLPVGSQVIRTVRKPQINKDGVMVQAAEIVVAQNLGDDAGTADGATTGGHVEGEPESESIKTEGKVAKNGGKDVTLPSENGSGYGRERNQREAERAESEQRPEGSGLRAESARAAQRSGDTSDIDRLAEGVASEQLDDNERRPRHQQEEAGDRIIANAKAAGWYIVPSSTRELGERYPKPTGESAVYIDEERGKVSACQCAVLQPGSLFICLIQWLVGIADCGQSCFE